jgi:hypothetical protein
MRFAMKRYDVQFYSLILLVSLGLLNGCEKKAERSAGSEKRGTVDLNEIDGALYFSTFGGLKRGGNIFLKQVFRTSKGKTEIMRKSTSLLDGHFRFDDFSAAPDGSKILYRNSYEFVVADASGNVLDEFKTRDYKAASFLGDSIWDKEGGAIYFVTGLPVSNISKYIIKKHKWSQLTHFEEKNKISSLIILGDNQRLVFTNKFIGDLSDENELRKIDPDVYVFNLATKELNKLNFKGTSVGMMSGSNNFIVLRFKENDIYSSEMIELSKKDPMRYAFKVFEGKTEFYLWNWDKDKAEYLQTIDSSSFACGAWAEQKIIYTYKPEALIRKIFLYDIKSKANILINTPESYGGGTMLQIMRVEWYVQ